MLLKQRVNTLHRWKRTSVTGSVLAAFAIMISSTVFVGTAAALPPPQGGYGSYSKEYTISGIPKYRAQDIMAELQRNFDGYFPFAGCGRSIRVGQVCQLQSPVGKAPVGVVAVETFGFSFKSLPGHPEGADRFINFQFRAADVVGNATLKSMKVDAWGKVSAGSAAGPINSVAVAGPTWQRFSDNINNKFPKVPTPGGAV